MPKIKAIMKSKSNVAPHTIPLDKMAKTNSLIHAMCDRIPNKPYHENTSDMKGQSIMQSVSKP